MKLYLTLLISFIFASLIFAHLALASDTSSPISTLSIDPASPTGANGWYNQSVDLLINASDNDSGVAKISYTLDDHATIDKNIDASINLIDNPSFEEHHNHIPYYWDRPPFSSNIYVSSKNSVDGIYSLRFRYNIWPINYVTNKSYYISAEAFKTYFFSAWIKTNVFGFGTNYEIMAIVNGENQLLYRSPSYFNLNDFTFVNNSFTTPSGTTGLYINLYSLGWGNTYFDSLYLGQITADSSVSFNVSEEAEHVILYNATDQAGNVGDENTDNFKIDITPPSNWQNFDYTKQGNDHTLKVNIDVTDNVSGIDLTSAYFQYYIEGVGWGVYEDLSKCSGNFLLDQWKVPSISYITNPTKALITTPIIDFCNSNWTQDKKIRFKLTDIAGNEAISPEFTINSPWIYATNFDIGSSNSISFTSPAKTDGFVLSKGDIVGVDSISNVYIKNYLSDTIFNTQNLVDQLTFLALPENKLPEINGRYKFIGNMTLDKKSINGYDKKSICSVIFIDGSLTISTDYSLKDSNSCLIFFVSGNLLISSNVNNIEGFFIVDGVFDTSTTNKTLNIKGGVIANEVKLLRSLSGKANLTKPAEYFDYDLNLLFNVSKLLSTSQNSIFWYEL